MSSVIKNRGLRMRIFRVGGRQPFLKQNVVHLRPLQLHINQVSELMLLAL